MDSYQKEKNYLYKFITGAYYLTFVNIIVLSFNNFYLNYNLIHTFFNILIFLFTVYVYFKIHKKDALIKSVIFLFWIVVFIHIIYFSFLPVNNSLYLLSFTPVILFIVIKDKNTLMLNLIIFYLCLFLILLFNYINFKFVDTENIVIFIIYNFLILTFGFYYHNTLKKFINELEELNKQNRFLLKEVHHRVKNNLNLLSAMIAMQIQNVTSKEELVENTQQRIKSIATLHELLYKKENISKEDLNSYINKIAQNFSVNELKFDINIPNIVLDFDKLLNIGIIFTEIIINNLKYNSSKEICISVYLKNNLLIIYDNSKIDISKFKKGFGFNLLYMATKSIKGNLKIYRKKDSVYYIINLPWLKDCYGL